MAPVTSNEDVAWLVPWFLGARYPGQFRPVMEGVPELGWVLEAGEALMIIRAGKATYPFIWIRGGIAHAVPRSEALSTYVAAGNKDLMVGRIYAAFGDELALVAFDDAIMAGDIDVERTSSLQDLVNRFENGMRYTAQWSKDVLEKFGGTPMTAEDWALLTF